MALLSADTPAELEKVQIDLLRRMPPWRKMALVGEMNRAVRTMGADLVADLRLEHTDPLAQALGNAFYADVEMMRDAVRRHSSFNLIHLETTFKVDVFVAKPRTFDRSQLARRQLYLLSEDPERHAYVTSAEDIILSKLECYRIGGEVSDRQWRDVLGVLKVQGDRLDRDYLRRMATELKVADLLERAFGEADLR